MAGGVGGRRILPASSEYRRMSTTSFGKLLRAYRLSYPVTEYSRQLGTTTLANMAGVDPSLIWRYENGQRKPSSEMVNKIADALQVDDTHRDMLLAAAGFRSNSMRSMANEPLTADLDELIAIASPKLQRKLKWSLSLLVESGRLIYAAEMAKEAA
jgi:transcriptional regulator with XRE-family HTH domain